MFPYQDLIRRRHFPWMTLLLILANVATFIYQASLSRAASLQFLFRYATIPIEFKLGSNLPISENLPPPLSLFTSLFLHGGLFHLVGNMLYLWVFGDNIEDRIGSFRFLLFYLVCGVAATFAHIYADFDSRLPIVGASGAIAGVLAAYLWLHPTTPIKVLVPIFFFLRTVILPAWLVLGGWILLQVLEVSFRKFFPLQTMQGGGGIAYVAHIGGFVAGLLLTPLFIKGKRR